MNAPRAPKGTYDLLPDEAARRDAIVAVAARVFGAYGYRHVGHARVRGDRPVRAWRRRGDRHRAQGDVHVRRQGRTLADAAPRGHRADLPRSTSSTACTSWPQPVKLWYYCPMFRYERPQAGRYREHYQLGAEALGSADPAVDAEVIAAARRASSPSSASRACAWRSTAWATRACRPAYVAELRDYLRGREAELCGDCRERIDAEPAAHVRLQGRVVPRGDRRGAAHRRPPVRRLPRALRRRARAAARASGSSRSSTSASCAASTTTRAPPSSSAPTASAPRAASAAAAATTASSSRSAGQPTPGVGLRRRPRAHHTGDAASGGAVPTPDAFVVTLHRRGARATPSAWPSSCAAPAWPSSWTSPRAASRASSSRPAAAARAVAVLVGLEELRRRRACALQRRWTGGGEEDVARRRPAPASRRPARRDCGKGEPDAARRLSRRAARAPTSAARCAWPAGSRTAATTAA